MKWINVKDRLPENNGKYLCWNGNDTEFQYFEHGYFLMSTVFKIKYLHERLPFTHWMELPKPPEE